MKDRFPDVTQNLGHVKFPDSRGRKGQKDKPVANVKTIVEIIMLTPGNMPPACATKPPSFSADILAATSR